MTRYFSVSVRLLDPQFHGKCDEDEPEWPPSPMRLFQALLAGSRTGCRNADWSDVRAAAFEWLERLSQQSPPEIVAPEVSRSSGYTSFVPNNDGDKKFDRQDRLTSKIVRPHRLVNATYSHDDRHRLHYLWGIRDEDWPAAEPHAKLLCREARNLLALGWGIDQAVGHGQILSEGEAAKLPGNRWRALLGPSSGKQTLRVPKEGSLKDLQRSHESFEARIRVVRHGRRTALEYQPIYRARVFDAVVYLPAGAVPPRHYAVFELPEGIAFRQEAANEVAAMLRSLACRCAQADTHEFPGGAETFVAGHLERDTECTPPRFSYLPLPTVGGEHADGMIRRLLVTEAYGGDGSHSRWAQQRLRGQVLRDVAGNERGVLLDLWRSGSRTMIHRYVEDSEAWASVTPLILPGFDDGNLKKRDAMVLKAISQAGIAIEQVTSFTLRKAPYWHGSQHPRGYRRPDYLKHYPGWHVYLRFQQQVSGPLVIGAGRHCGLGLFAAWKEGESMAGMRAGHRRS